MTTAWPIWAMLILVAVVHTIGRRERFDHFHTTKAFSRRKYIFIVIRNISKYYS